MGIIDKRLHYPVLEEMRIILQPHLHFINHCKWGKLRDRAEAKRKCLISGKKQPHPIRDASLDFLLREFPFPYGTLDKHRIQTFASNR